MTLRVFHWRIPNRGGPNRRRPPVKPFITGHPDGVRLGGKPPRRLLPGDVLQPGGGSCLPRLDPGGRDERVYVGLDDPNRAPPPAPPEAEAGRAALGALLVDQARRAARRSVAHCAKCVSSPRTCPRLPVMRVARSRPKSRSGGLADNGPGRPPEKSSDFSLSDFPLLIDNNTTGRGKPTLRAGSNVITDSGR